jgi:hypothetical protein
MQSRREHIWEMHIIFVAWVVHSDIVLIPRFSCLLHELKIFTTYPKLLIIIPQFNEISLLTMNQLITDY